VRQLIDPNMRKYLKDYQDTFGTCNFIAVIDNTHYCHFLGGACDEMGRQAEMVFGIPERFTFYRCNYKGGKP